MAEDALFSLAGELIKILGSLVAQEVALYWGVKSELHKLQRTVTRIKSVLDDAEEQAQKQNNQVKVWLGELREVVFDAEDLLDDFSIVLLRKQLMSGGRVSKEVRVFFSRSNQFVFGWKMGHKVKELRERLNEIDADSKQFNFEVRDEERASLTTMVRERETTSAEPEVIVGREGEKEAVIGFLLNSNYEENVSVISIVGMGGLGKTTLAQHVFNGEQVKSHFSVRFWVSVSGSLEVKKIVKDILEVIGASRESDQLETLKSRLEEQIKDKKYLLVLDDVWDGENWDTLKQLLPRDVRGSKIITTTRSVAIAKLTSTINPLDLKGLPDEPSWSLFKKKAFRLGEESNVVDERIKREIVARCYGVPLVIKAIAGLMSLKDKAQWWSFVVNELPDRVQDDNILQTLKLSYDALPSHTKHCFAYCRLFSKGKKIDVQSMIQLWIAQGFISPSNPNECLELAGRRCFEDLLWRSFFHEVEKDELGNIESCKMHDFMHDLAAKVAGSGSVKLDREGISLCDSTRHVSFDMELDLSQQFPIPLLNAKRLRTLLIRLQFGTWDEKAWESIFREFRCLRVLDLHQLGMMELSPDLTEKLKHLRYLDLSNNHMETLPNSIDNLVNLQVLKLNDCWRLEALPRDINKLINLRHIYNDGCQSLKHMPYGIGQLTSLQTLTYFVLGVKDGSRAKQIGGLDELKRLNKLRGKLEIRVVGYERNSCTSEFKEAKLSEKKYLQRLTINCGLSNDASDVDIDIYDEMLKSLQPHSNLQVLVVIGYGGMRFPSWFSYLTNLNRISVSNCPRCEYIPPIDGIPSLEVLEIGSLSDLEYIDSEWVRGSEISKFFPSLKTLLIKSCPKLKGWWKKSRSADSDHESSSRTPAVEEALTLYFPCLSFLEIRNCPKLTSMPLFPSLDDELVLDRSSSLTLQQTMKATVAWKSPILVSFSSSSSFCPLSQLKKLTMYYVDDVESLPEDGLQNLSSLQLLSISGCPGLKSLPLSQNLQQLRVNKYEGITFPSWLSYLTNLKTISLGLCRRCKHIPPLDGIPFLEELSIDFMSDLEYIDSEGAGGRRVSTFFPSLKKLQIVECLKLKGWWKSRRDDNDHESSSRAPTIEGEEYSMLYFPCLSSLEITHCPNLTSMPLFPSLDSYLSLLGASSIPLQQTMKMTASAWKSPAPVSSPSSSSSSSLNWPPLSKLKKLTIKQMDDMESLPEDGLQNLSSLQQLEISFCSRLKSLSLSHPIHHSLEKILIQNCKELRTLCPSHSQWRIPRLPSLQWLNIGSCSDELMGRLRGGKKAVEAEWPNISHIPKIQIDANLIQWNNKYLGP